MIARLPLRLLEAALKALERFARLGIGLFDIAHVGMFIDPTLCLTEPHAIDDRRVVQTVRYNGGVFVEQGFE